VKGDAVQPDVKFPVEFHFGDTGENRQATDARHPPQGDPAPSRSPGEEQGGNQGKSGQAGDYQVEPDAEQEAGDQICRGDPGGQFDWHTGGLPATVSS